MKEVVIARFTYRHEAEFAQGFLQDAGISARIMSDDAGATHPNLSFLSGSDLIVLAGDEGRATFALRSAGMLGDEDGQGGEQEGEDGEEGNHGEDEVIG